MFYECLTMCQVISELFQNTAETSRYDDQWYHIVALSKIQKNICPDIKINYDVILSRVTKILQ